MPCTSPPTGIGSRSTSVSEVHVLVNRYGCNQSSDGIELSTPNTTAPATVAAITTIGCSVHADTASAMPATANTCTATHPVAIATRSTAWPVDSVLPSRETIPCEPTTRNPVIIPTTAI